MTKKKTRAKVTLKVSYEDLPLCSRDYDNLEDTMASLRNIKKKLRGGK